jgi:hypothetical protein
MRVRGAAYLRELSERSSESGRTAGESGRTADHVVAATGGGATSLGSACSRHGDAHRDQSRTRRSALQAANFSSSWPGKGGLGRGGGLGPSPAEARARAIASRSLASSTSFIAPRQRGQVITSTANTRWSSHAQGCRFEGFVLPGEAQPASSSVASPTNNLNCVGAAGGGTRPGTTSLRAAFGRARVRARLLGRGRLSDRWGPLHPFHLHARQPERDRLRQLLWLGAAATSSTSTAPSTAAPRSVATRRSAAPRRAPAPRTSSPAPRAWHWRGRLLPTSRFNDLAPRADQSAGRVMASRRASTSSVAARTNA